MADPNQPPVQPPIPPEPLPLPPTDRRHGTSGAEKAPFILMMIITCGLFGMLIMMNFHAVPESSTTLMNIILGGIAAAWTQGINYFFGSSASTAKKDAALATVAAKAPVTPTPTTTTTIGAASTTTTTGAPAPGATP